MRTHLTVLIAPILAISLAACTAAKSDGTSADSGEQSDGGTSDGGADGGGADGGADGGAGDGGSDGGGDGGEATLYGTPPAQQLPAPEFAARHYDGTPRTRDDLIGNPVVMWFYPAAGTAG